MLEGFSFEEETVAVHPGDLLVIFSDGVSEAMNTLEEMYTERRLEDILRSEQPRSLPDICEAVLQDIQQFTSPAPQHDDITLVLLQRRAG
jgi:serine phosphatase RsbU (regulator of sigma subunit)